MEHPLDAELVLNGPVPATTARNEVVPQLANEAIAHTLDARGEGHLAEWKLEGEKLRVILESRGPRPLETRLAFVRHAGPLPTDVRFL